MAEEPFEPRADHVSVGFRLKWRPLKIKWVESDDFLAFRESWLTLIAG